MTLIGIILLALGILLSRTLSPKKDPYSADFIAIQHMLWPKVVAILVTFAGLITLIVGLID